MSNRRVLVLIVGIVLSILGPPAIIILINSIDQRFLNSVYSVTDSWLTGVPRDYNNPDPNTPELICSDEGDPCFNPDTERWTQMIISISGVGPLLYLMLVRTTWATMVYGRHDVDPVSMEEMRYRLLALNDEKIPFEIIVDKRNPNKLVARWKIVDSKWIQIFSINRLTKYYELRMRLVDRGSKGRYVKAQDYLKEMEYVAGTDGIPPLRIRVRYFSNLTKGIMLYHYDRGFLYGLIYKDGQFKIDYAYNYRFVTTEIKNPIIQIITQSGWDFKPTIFLL